MGDGLRQIDGTTGKRKLTSAGKRLLVDTGEACCCCQSGGSSAFCATPSLYCDDLIPTSVDVTFAGLLDSGCCIDGGATKYFKLRDGWTLNGTFTCTGADAVNPCGYIGSTTVTVDEWDIANGGCGGAADDSNVRTVDIFINFLQDGGGVYMKIDAHLNMTFDDMFLFCAVVDVTSNVCQDALCVKVDNEFDSACKTIAAGNRCGPPFGTAYTGINYGGTAIVALS